MSAFRGVAQVVERYFREVEAACSSHVTPILCSRKAGNIIYLLFCIKSPNTNILFIKVFCDREMDFWLQSKKIYFFIKKFLSVKSTVGKARPLWKNFYCKIIFHTS